MTGALTWGDLGEQFDGPHATPQRRQDGPYFLNISSLESGRLNLALSDRISDEEYAKWTRRVTPQADDLLYSYETRLGEAALMPSGVRACLGRRMALLRPNRDIVDPRFLLYYYLSPQFQRTIAKHTIHGATVPRILLSEMPSWPVALPSLTEQRAIAEVLAALDDKIAANARLADVADELVRAHFSRIGARADEAITIGEIASHPRDLVDPTEIAADTPYVGLEHVPRRHMWMTEHGNASDVTSTKARFAAGDVLFGKLRPYFHKVVSAPTPGIASTDILVARPKTPSLAGFVLAAVSSDTAVEHCSAASEGTRMPRTSWKDLAAVQVPWPGESAAREVSVLIEGLGSRVAAGVLESARLAATRDALLPGLMSGKIRAKDAEKTVEEVV